MTRRARVWLETHESHQSCKWLGRALRRHASGQESKKTSRCPQRGEGASRTSSTSTPLPVGTATSLPFERSVSDVAGETTLDT